MNKALDKLREILIEQDVAINSAIERKTINWDMVVEYNKDAIKSIKKLRKKLVNFGKCRKRQKKFDQGKSCNYPVIRHGYSW